MLMIYMLIMFTVQYMQIVYYMLIKFMLTVYIILVTYINSFYQIHMQMVYNETNMNGTIIKGRL